MKGTFKRKSEQDLRVTWMRGKEPRQQMGDRKRYRKRPEREGWTMAIDCCGDGLGGGGKDGRRQTWHLLHS